jgi:DNA-directed RNA polymerase specialized sigma24 family protein
MPTPRPAPAELAARRHHILTLHRRHAGRVRALFYWFGADLEIIDDAVLRTFLLAARHDPPDRGALPWLARIAWRIASRPDRSTGNDLDEAPAIPSLPPAADLLARLLAIHAPTLPQRAAFVLHELAGLPLPDLAAALARDPEALRSELAHLREVLVRDPEVLAIGGPRPLLLASIAPFVDDPAWHRRHAAALLAHLPRPPLTLREQLRRPPGILALGLAAVALLLLLRPPPPVAKPRVLPPPVVVATPLPPPPLVAPPLPLPVPPVMSPEPAPVARVVRKPRTPRAPKARTSSPSARSWPKPATPARSSSSSRCSAPAASRSRKTPARPSPTPSSTPRTTPRVSSPPSAPSCAYEPCAPSDAATRPAAKPTATRPPASRKPSATPANPDSYRRSIRQH